MGSGFHTTIGHTDPEINVLLSFVSTVLVDHGGGPAHGLFRARPLGRATAQRHIPQLASSMPKHAARDSVASALLYFFFNLCDYSEGWTLYSVIGAFGI